MVPSTFSPTAAWLVKLREQPLEALEECRTAFQAGEVSRNARLYAMIAALVVFVDALADSPEDEAAFRAHPFWNDSRRVLKSKRLSVLAVRYVLGAERTEGALYEQARSYALAVEHFRHGQFDTDEIIARLQRRGIYGLLDQLAGDGEEPESDSGGGDLDPAGDEEGSGDGAPSEESASDSSSDEGSGADGDGDAASNDTQDEVGSRAWWAAFLAHAKEIYADGRAPVLVAARWSDLDDLRRRSRSRPAVLTVSQPAPADAWAAFVCERVERTRGAKNVRDVPDRPERLFPALPLTCGMAEPSAEPVLLQRRT